MATNLGNSLLNPHWDFGCGYSPDTARATLLTILLAAGSGMRGAAIATACATVLFAAPANAAIITFNESEGVLTIKGDAAADGLVAGLTPAGTITLNGSEVLGGAATVANVLVVHMEGGAGNDILRFDESNGAMPRGEFVGGEGRDTLVGGSQADSLVGGAGIDRIIGGPGDDTVSMGDDADEFRWNPGDGNDHVDGDGGKDTLIFNAGPEELVQLFPNGSRAVLFLQADPFSPPGTPPRLEMSVSGFELLKLNVADFPGRHVRINDMPGAGVGVVRVNFAPHVGPGTAFQDVLYRGTVGADLVRISGSPARGVTVFGGAETVLFDHANRLTVFGGDGDDVIDATGLAAGTVQLDEFGGGNPFIENPRTTDGDDTLIGTPGDDGLFGGDGANRIDGRGGNDTIIGG